MAGLAVYLMDIFNWKDDAVITNIQANFPVVWLLLNTDGKAICGAVPN